MKIIRLLRKAFYFEPITESISTSMPSYLPSLDGLRGLSILLVLADMLNVLENHHGLAAILFDRISNIGWIGVQLFFVLSGFLITGILLDTKKAKNYYSGFYARRTLRIFPLYFGVLALAFIILPHFITLPSSLAFDQQNQIWLWLYLSNWASYFKVGSMTFPHFWSLAVEEQFYLVWPFFIRRLNPEKCLRFCLGLAVVSLLIRIIMTIQNPTSPFIYQNSFCRMDALTLGGAAASMFRIQKWKDFILDFHQRFLVWGILTALIGAIITKGYWNNTIIGETFGYSFVALMFTMFLIAVTAADMTQDKTWSRFLRISPLKTLGKYSYAIYVFHKPLNDFFGKPLATKFQISNSVFLCTVYFLVGVLLILFAAIISWNIFEKHILQLKKFFIAKY